MFGISQETSSTGWRKPLQIGTIGLSLLAATAMTGMAQAERADTPRFQGSAATELTFRHDRNTSRIIKHAAPHDYRRNSPNRFTFRDGNRPGQIIKHSTATDDAWWLPHDLNTAGEYTFRDGNRPGQIIKHADAPRDWRGKRANKLSRFYKIKKSKGHYGNYRGFGRGKHL